MEATVCYFLILQKCVILKQKTLKQKNTVCLGIISNDFRINNMKKNRIERRCHFFSIDYILLILMIC